MASARMFSLLSFLSFILFAIAAPSTSSLEKRSDVVQFTIDLTWGDFNPTGGVARKAIFTNGTIPGPALNLKVGQSVEFTVINNLPYTTSVHFHGISQEGTPFSDGVPGLTQYPIPVGASFLYQWTATEAGTYFYHAHHKGQMMDGLYGAIIIAAADNADRPFGLISQDAGEVKKMMAAEKMNEPLFISDWTQYTFAEFYSIQQAANIDNACTDAIIVNGKGSVICQSRADINKFTPPPLAPILAANNPSQLTDKACLPANLVATQGPYNFTLSALPPAAYDVCTPATGGMTKVTVDPAAGWAAMTFINTGGFSSLKFTIDSHSFWVYAVNGHYVKPQYVNQAAVDNGDRYSILVKLDQAAGTYPIRIANNGLNQLISGQAALEYKGTSGSSNGAIPSMNWAGINMTALKPWVDAISAPYPAIAPSPKADQTFSMNIKKLDHPYVWTLSGGQAYSMDRDDQTPLLFQDPNSIPDSDLIYRTKTNQWVDLIVKVQGPLAQPHPIHKHANKAFMLGQGTGPFNYSTVAEAAAAMPAGTFNFVNPPYGDGFTTIPAERNSTWMVLRYQADNPGAWVVHCHMQTHFSGGMAAVLLDGIDKFPSVPNAYKDGSCGFGYSASANSSSGSGNGSSKGSGNGSGSGSASATGSSNSASKTTASASSSTSSGSARASNGSSSGIATFTGAASTVQFSSSMTSTLLLGSALLVAAFSL